MAAVDAGKFKDEIIPVTVKGRKGETESSIPTNIRAATPVWKSWRKLKPTFKEDGRVTAGNSSGMNDAASGVILMAEGKARELGTPILARIKKRCDHRRSVRRSWASVPSALPQKALQKPD